MNHLFDFTSPVVYTFELWSYSWIVAHTFDLWSILLNCSPYFWIMVHIFESWSILFESWSIQKWKADASIDWWHEKPMLGGWIGDVKSQCSDGLLTWKADVWMDWWYEKSILGGWISDVKSRYLGIDWQHEEPTFWWIGIAKWKADI